MGLRIVNGFGWAWVILGGGVEAAARLRNAVAAARGTAPGADRATGLLLAGWLEASGGNVEQATADIERAMALGGDEVLSLARLHLAFVHTVQSQPRQALELSAACQTEFHRLGRDWEEGASWLLSAWAHIALGALADGQTASQEALKLIRPLGDNWGLSHAEALLGGLAQAEHRFADAVDHLERAAEAAGNLGFGAAAAHHLTNLGRVHQEAGDLGSARTALHQAIAAAQAVGDARTAAYARAHLGWVLRALGEHADARLVLMAAREWFEAAGGGEGAVLADYALAALDADRGLTQAANRLDEVLAAARRDGQGEVEVLTLDRLARLHAERGDLDRRQRRFSPKPTTLPGGLSPDERQRPHRPGPGVVALGGFPAPPRIIGVAVECPVRETGHRARPPGQVLADRACQRLGEDNPMTTSLVAPDVTTAVQVPPVQTGQPMGGRRRSRHRCHPAAHPGADRATVPR